MTQRKVGCAILAAGHSQIGNGTKLVAMLEGKPLINHVVSAVKKSGVFDHIAVVCNHNNIGSIMAALMTEGLNGGLSYVFQPQPYGMPHAVFTATKQSLAGLGCKHVLMIPGDAPFWHPRTLRVAVREHLNPKRHPMPKVTRELFPLQEGESFQPDVTMLTAPYDASSPCAEFVSGRSFLTDQVHVNGGPTWVLNQGEQEPPHGAEITTGVAVFRAPWILGLSKLFESNGEIETDNRHPVATALPSIVNTYGARVANLSVPLDLQSVDINSAEDLTLIHERITSRVTA